MIGKCICYHSVSKLEKPAVCDQLCRSECKNIHRYNELVKLGKIDIIQDLANFDKYKQNGGKNNGSSNKRNFKRTISKSRKKFISK